jgi:hypothetical protein
MQAESLKRYNFKKRKNKPIPTLRLHCHISAYFASFHDGEKGNRARILEK